MVLPSLLGFCVAGGLPVSRTSDEAHGGPTVVLVHVSCGCGSASRRRMALGERLSLQNPLWVTTLVGGRRSSICHSTGFRVRLWMLRSGGSDRIGYVYILRVVVAMTFYCRYQIVMTL